jgi:hypothetical protein
MVQDTFSNNPVPQVDDRPLWDVVFADYSQTQNKIDDKENSPKQAQPHSSSHKKDDNNKAKQNSSENEKRDINSGGPREESPQKSSY